MRLMSVSTVLLILCSFNAATAALNISNEDADKIGHKIWKNECGKKIEGLTSWNKGEDFASLGIGHFIWYPDGKRGPFVETFPELLEFLKESGTELPIWLNESKGCPWKTKSEFDAAFHSTKLVELRQLLTKTVSLQAQFMAKRLESALPKMTENLSHEQKQHVVTQFYRIAKTPKGLYAFVDYLNFKGEGISASERYHGEGWGLLQILLAIDPSLDPIEGLVSSAKKVLTKRVANSPPERNENRWLPGWLNRINTYKDNF